MQTLTRRIGGAAVLAVAALVGVLAWWMQQRSVPADGLLQINGRIEGDRVTIAPKTAGRVVELRVHEGDVVTSGQVLVRLDDRAVRARLEQAEAAVQTLQAQIAAQQAALVVMRGETALALNAARNRMAAAEADARRAAAAHAQDERDHARARDLSEQGFIGPQAMERTGLALKQSAEQRDAADALLEQSRQLVRDAQLGPQRVRTREAELAVSRARLQEATATVAEAQSALDDMVIRAPAGGTVVRRFTHAGEVVGAGAPLLDLIDLGQLYLKGYLPEPQIGRVRRGMAARVHVDAFPGEGFNATLRYVASRAEFTPKEVQTVDERVRLVYEVRLYLEQDAAGRLSPGQPADAMIRTREDVAWHVPRR
ncbi:MAG: HlyD family secretion protein [Burkholderiaceae bacterium]|nr:HlyD family secretion protein [Burkholderiaceae bacterium]